MIQSSCLGYHVQLMKRLTATSSHMLHIRVRMYGNQRVIVQATDTDVLLMPLYYSTHIPFFDELWFYKSHVYLPCPKIAADIASVCNADSSFVTSVLLTARILSGCDTVRYAFCHSKKCAMKSVLENIAILQALAQYGESNSDLHLNREVQNAAKVFFKGLYNVHDFERKFNEL